MKWIVTTVLLAGIWCVMAQTVSAQNNNDWRTNLTEEIQDVQGCQVSFFSQIVEREIKGRSVIMAKVHCEDARTFDAIRPDEGEMFTFTVCRKRDERVC